MPAYTIFHKPAHSTVGHVLDGNPFTPSVAMHNNIHNSGVTASGVLNGASDRDNQKYNAEQAQIYRDWSAQQAAITRDYNSREAQKNRDYLTNMSNTAYQRAKADMIKAGLNPYLAYGQGGASVVSTSSASASSPSGASASYSGVNSGARVATSTANSVSNFLSSMANMIRAIK